MKAPLNRPNQWLSWGIAVLCLLGIAGFAVFYFTQPSLDTQEMRFEISTPATLNPTFFAISPDGLRLVFAASTEGQQQLWVRLINQTSAQPLAGTEGASTRSGRQTAVRSVSFREISYEGSML